MKYEVTANITLTAESAQEAQEMAAACVEHWSDKTGLKNISGAGCPNGYVQIRAIPKNVGVRGE